MELLLRILSSLVMGYNFCLIFRNEMVSKCSSYASLSRNPSLINFFVDMIRLRCSSLVFLAISSMDEKPSPNFDLPNL